MPLVSESHAVHFGNIMPLLAELTCRWSGICKLPLLSMRTKNALRRKSVEDAFVGMEMLQDIVDPVWRMTPT